MDGNPVRTRCGPYEAVRYPSWQENPVALFQEDPLAVHLKFGSALKQDDPLIVVLVIVDRLVDY